MPIQREYSLRLVVQKELEVALVDQMPHLTLLGRLEDHAVGMEDPDAHQFLVLADHLQNHLHVGGVADAHGVVDAALYGV